MEKKYNTYADIKASFDTFRSSMKKILESEGNFGEIGGIPYTMNDEMMKNIVEITKTNFSADYTGLKNPMLYYPNNDNIILSGVVPSLNNLQFMYKYPPQDGIGCYIWHADNMALNNDNLGILKKMVGTYENWKEELDKMTDKKPINFKNN